jgi:hypothetical protein
VGTNHSNWRTNASDSSQPANVGSFLWRLSSGDKFLDDILAIPPQRSSLCFCFSFLAGLAEKATDEGDL